MSLFPLRAAALALATAIGLSAAVVSGSVQDPSGAGIPGAVVHIRGGALKQPVELKCSATGAFSTPDLSRGSYEFQAEHPDFAEATRQVTVDASALSITIQLPLRAERQSVTVRGGPGQFANSDPVYRQLRDVGLGNAFHVHEAALDIDTAHLVFHDGIIRFLKPVQGHMTGAVFTGSAHLTLTPFLQLDRDEMKRRNKTEVFDEDVKSVVMRFTGQTQRTLLRILGEAAEPDPAADRVFSDWKQHVRERHEIPVSQTDAMLSSEAMDNVDADILATIYNPAHPGFFNAYMRGTKHSDLRFFMREHGGAIPAMDSPEEVALINVSETSLDDGVFYMQHLKSEWAQHTARSDEDQRFFAVDKYTLDTYIATNTHLAGTARLDMHAVVPGERVVKFRLLPNLRVSRVTGADGKDLYYVQEGRKQDGSFYAVLPAPADPKVPVTVHIEYAGDKVIANAGGGSFYVNARETWYPTPNTFTERSQYDLTFHVPKRDRIISIGKLEREWTEDKEAVSHWATTVPVPVAGFNYGEYKQMPMSDEKTGTELTGYYLPELPDILRGAASPFNPNVAQNAAVSSIAPGSMTKYALTVARAQVELCTDYFGGDGFDRLYLTEQPNAFFGQSWPNLVYLPILAYVDSTQRYMLLGRISSSLNQFVDEVIPHEVAHQWWGHAVPWASYHDQWISEGFAEFSAGLFLQHAKGANWQADYKQFWDRLRHRAMDRTQFGKAPNDEGPIWLGYRLESGRAERGGVDVIYPKGAFILGMLRSLMYTNKEQDKAFIEMMHDFVASHKDRPASTETFAAIVQKHITPNLNLAHDGSVRWFFDQWVYGTEVPKYDFSYTSQPDGKGGAKVKVTLTQSQVSPAFHMAVPIFIENAKGEMLRVGQLPVTGNDSTTTEFDLPLVPKSVRADALGEILQR